MEQLEQYHKIIAGELGVKTGQVAAASGLLADGATIPFIARYRKEVTELLDETQLTAIRDRLTTLGELDKRRKAILDSLAERELLTSELSEAVKQASSLAVLEDIYLPYRPKRRTRGMIATEKGLEPLARAVFSGAAGVEPQSFLDPQQDLAEVEQVLAGARDIIAEWVNEDAGTRAALRRYFFENGVINSSVVKKNQEKGAKFRDYFAWSEPAAKAPGHRLLAMLRGENEKVLSLSIRPPQEEVLTYLHRKYVKKNDWASQVTLAVDDCYKRLLGPSLENEYRNHLKEKADQEAITVFVGNLKELLLAPPLGRKAVMALDPGFRTGAKLVCLDGQGKLLDHTVIYPTHGGKQAERAGAVVLEMCGKYNIEAIAVGNGTAGRETESFVRALDLPAGIVVTMVDESGASIYSASPAGVAEFPDHDVTVRGAVSIGRRLRDPLAELVKIDPKSIGVGQYQHDVNQKELKKSLDDVVVGCVNNVGVDANTAGVELLTRVSGLGPTLAKNIVAYRDEHGPFVNRKQLLKVPRLGAKAFEQCAGFLRIQEGTNPLDNSAVHPERYAVVEQMARDVGCETGDLLKRSELRRQIDLSRYVTDAMGMPTLTDIMTELEKPGRDPRAAFSAFAFAEGVNSITDLQPEMQLPGIVTNVTKFGAFVDIGVHRDGLVHISHLADRFVKDPAEVVRVRQEVMVRVLEVDVERGRISLSMRDQNRK